MTIPPHFLCARLRRAGLFLGLLLPAILCAQPPSDEAHTLDAVTASAAAGDALPAAAAGGQIARGARVGMLGNREALETPFSITGYTEEFIRSQSGQTVSDMLARADPGVFTSSGAGIPQDDYTIRGLALRNSDVALNGLYGILPNWRISPEFAERIEVQKGPSAMLGGMPPYGTVGGSINLVPKRAPVQPLARVTGLYLSDAQFGTHVDLGRRFGGAQQLGLRLNTVWRDGDTPVDKQSWRNQMLALGLDWRVQPGLRLSADVLYKKERIDGSDRGISLAAGAPLPAPPAHHVLLTPEWTYSESVDSAAMLRLDADLGAQASAHFSLGASEMDYDALSNISPAVLDAAGTFRTRFQHQRRVLKKQSADAGLRLRFDSASVGHELALNASWFHEDSHFAFLRSGGDFDTVWTTDMYHPEWPAPFARDFAALMPPKTAQSQLLGLAVADTLAFMDDRLLLTLGVRRQNVRNDTLNATTGARTAHYNQSATTPTLAALFKPGAHMSLYANSTQGLSRGSSAPDTADNAGEVFAPYKTRQREIGLKTDGGNVGMTLAAFEIKRPASYTDPHSNIFSFGGEQRNRGLEWGFFGAPHKSLRLMGGISHTDARLTRTAGGLHQGRRAPIVPRWQGKLRLEYAPPSAPGLHLGAGLLALSRQYLDNANSRTVPGRGLLDLSARYDWPLPGGRTLEWRASVNNLTNKKYWSGTLSSGRGAARNWLLSASMAL